MDVVIFALVLVGLAGFVAAPLYRPTPAETPEPRDDAGLEAIARAVRDLELDRASGLVDTAAYEHERAALDRQAQTTRDARGD